uniref:Paraneoplastic antigen Ma-like C-terminal domain-containing protein n=1 Tax=Pygocentrus nattereri TaxID=42514 RepID=A0AAR2IPB4_PYGNA
MDPLLYSQFQDHLINWCRGEELDINHGILIVGVPKEFPLEGHSYRRLRMFSGVIPTPAGEESIEHWLEQAYVMVEECECSEKEKKHRIMESVKGPAQVIQSVRSSEPESAEDVYFSFRLLQQRSGERLSDFLRRLEKSLTKVVQMGGLPSRDRDRAHVEQLLWGAVASDLLLVQLRLRERKNNPPSFLELLGEIRVEEEYLVSQRQDNTAVRPVETVNTTEADQSVVLSLRAELKDVKARLKELTAPSRRSSSKEEEIEMPSYQAAPDPECPSELTSLRKQLKKLQQDMSDMKKKESGASAAVLQVATSTNYSPAEKRLQHNTSADYFYYRCGEDGHIASKCRAPENEKEVIQKLLGSLRKLKEGKTGKAAPAELDRLHCSSKRSAVDVASQRAVPSGLIGPSPIVQTKINDKLCSALLDSGSQVIIIFEEWHQKHLTDVPIQPVSGLAVWGLSESSYPYKGYVVVDVQFPKELVGVQETM